VTARFSAQFASDLIETPADTSLLHYLAREDLLDSLFYTPTAGYSHSSYIDGFGNISMNS
jgi:hypothetical protein